MKIKLINQGPKWMSGDDYMYEAKQYRGWRGWTHIGYIFSPSMDGAITKFKQKYSKIARCEKDIKEFDV